MIEHPAAQDRSPVLVVGASFAGLATAWWMTHLGYRVTVIEISNGLRKGGTPVDIEGETIDVLTRMGMIDAVRDKALPPREFQFRDADDSIIGEMPPQTAAQSERYEIHRDDLLEILFASVRDKVELTFGRSIKKLTNEPESVAVTFDDGSDGAYELVFGCDGNRSRTRRLAFGDEGRFSHFMGGYFFIKVARTTGLLPANVSQIFSVPGRTALLNGYDDQTDIALAFRSTSEIDYDYRDRTYQRRMIHDQFDELGWKVPAMLAHLDADDDFYFDKVSQIRMPTWSNGRVALVGDAGYCVSPVAGMGGSVAIIGAARLADAMLRYTGDHSAAFRDYYDRLNPFIKEVQEKAANHGMAMMFPSDDAELADRNRRITTGALDL